MATLINGDGNPAVYAVEDADWYIGLLGGATRILNRGLKFAYHVEDINTFLMDDGLILTKEGRRIQLDANAQDEITIPNGVQGSTQYYIVGYHLYTDSLANQKCETFIQQMDNATDTITENTFYDGATEVYVSLYRITQTELVVTDVELLLPYDTTQAQDRASLALSLSDLRASFMDADTALSGRITTNTNNIANTKDIISNVEEGNTATQAYSIGDYVQYVNAGTTYFAKVLSPIAIGDTFTNGTNVDNSTVAEQLGAGTARTTLTPPTASGSYTYDGTEKTVVWSNYDPTKIEIQGTQSATNAGTYTCTAVIKDSYNYCWTDGTNAPIQVNWTIAKATDTPTITGSTSVRTSADVQTAISITNATGINDAVSSDTNIVTTNISGNTLYLTGGNTEGIATVTITTNGNDNYNSGSLVLNITNVIVALVPFSSATDQQFDMMFASYYNGIITLDDIKSVWSVGDTRTISLSAMLATEVGESHRAQNVQIQILGFDHDTLVTPIGNKTKTLITVDLKSCLAAEGYETTNGQTNPENGYINQTATNAGGWNNSARRTWCNSVFFNALPSYIQNLVKDVIKVANSGSPNYSATNSNDKVFLLSEKEMFNTSTNSVIAEGTQYELYAGSTNNLIKLPKWSNTYVCDTYWGRSASNETYGGGAGTYWQVVGANVNNTVSKANQGFGLAPAFCM